MHDRLPWNAGKNVRAKRPLKPRDIWAMGLATQTPLVAQNVNAELI